MTLITTPTTGGAWSPDGYAFAPSDVVPDALILKTATVAGEIDGDAPTLRVAFVDDVDTADYVAEGATITESDPTLDEVEIKTKKISRLVNLSSEQFRQPQTPQQIAQSVARDLVAKADASYLGDTDPVGLLNAPGVVDGGPIGVNLDALVDLVAELEANGANPTAIILDPLGWAEFRKLKTGDTYNSSLLGAGTSDAQALLLSLPILRSRFIPAHSGMVVDRNAIAAAAGTVRVAQSEHALFANDAVQIRATWRIGWKPVRADRLGRFTIGDASSV
ncbi:phage major capsid protein [Mycolicibacterium gilvum]|uniref:phage major capsid protein n=1 Tax=Mycolicibacterium gilvum TaxID=1804 RepID=UPI004045EF31